jgi:hypothetical protein
MQILNSVMAPVMANVIDLREALGIQNELYSKQSVIHVKCSIYSTTNMSTFDLLNGWKRVAGPNGSLSTLLDKIKQCVGQATYERQGFYFYFSVTME